jgi:hypothetical protein
MNLTESRNPSAMSKYPAASGCMPAWENRFWGRGLARIAATVAMTVLGATALWAGDAQYTQRGAANRQGLYDNEVYLTPQNVNVSLFGNLFTYNVDGQVAAQLLYVPNVNISGVGTVNVLYVVTENDSVYAFNADTPGSGNALWQVSFLNTSNGVNAEPIASQGCPGVTGYTEVGITGTPVIDPNTNTIYMVAKTQEQSGSTYNYVFRLHALDITTGAEKFGGPTVITASVISNGKTIALNPQVDQQRPALLEMNGSIFIAFGSNGCDKGAHGWLLAYSASTLTQQGVFVTSTATTGEASLWMSGIGPAADASNNLYLVTANGTFDINTGGSDWGDTVMQMTFNGSSFTVTDSFTPFNQGTMAQQDLDLGAGAAVLLPPQTVGPPNLLVEAGKTGTIYLINCDDMGGYNTTQDNIVQELPAAVQGIWGAPVYWNNALYFAGRGDTIKGFNFVNGMIQTPPVESSNPYTLQGIPSISANGNNSGLLWLIHNLTANNPTQVLAAFNASTFQTSLAKVYDTQQNSTRDALGNVPHFATPLVANGKVYVGGSAQVKIYGLFPELNPSAGNFQSATVNTPITLTAQAVSPYTGAALPGVSVTFYNGAKGGQFVPNPVITDSNGNATTSYTLPQTAGTLTVTATSPGYSTASFTETGVAGPPAVVAAVSGANQSGPVGTALPAPLVVKVKDSFGNLVSNAQGTFADGMPTGSFYPNPATTSSNGQASTNFTLPTVAKSFNATATSGSATVANFKETSLAGPPASIATDGGNKQIGMHGTQLPKPLKVTVADQYGNPVPNVTVNFIDNNAGGNFTSWNPVTSNQGVASTMYTLPPTTGTITITATVSSYSVNFTETSN